MTEAAMTPIVSIVVEPSADGAGVYSLTFWGAGGEAAEIDFALPASRAEAARALRALADAVLEGAG